MDTIQNNMEISNAGIQNVNFKLHLDIYNSQRTPSVSPTGLSDESEEDLMALNRKEEVHVVSRNSSTSSSVDEKLSQLGSNVEDKSSGVDVDSEDGLFNDDIMREIPDCSMQKPSFTCESCELITFSFQDYLHHKKSAHSVKVRIHEFRSFDFATSIQRRLTTHEKAVHCFNKVVDSHSSTAKASIEERHDHISASPYLDSAERNTTFNKKEAKDMEDDNCDSLADGASKSLANSKDMVDEVFDKTTKKKKTRQEVDPSKYIEVVKRDSTKFACSMCANIYAWRKSLNKHWKEKHNMQLFLNVVNSPGMGELLKDGKYTLVEERVVYETAFLRELKVPQSDNLSLTPHTSSPSYSSHHPDMLNKSPSLPPLSTRISELPAPNLFFPGNSVAIPQFPVHNVYDPSEDILDLTCGRNQSSETSALSGTHDQDETLPSEQEQPLNLSRSSNSLGNAAPEKFRMKVVSCMTQSVQSDSLGHSETEYPGLKTSQMSKKVVQCFECKVQMKCMDVLNKHYMKHHIHMLSDYKQASKKIPHGLQQCHHLLDMKISDVVELSNQDLDRMTLKCKNCGYEAKGAADLQKHTMTHAGERPHICMVCGATYKFKWDLVKHFERSHANLPNPYRRNDKKDTSNESSEEDGQPLAKKEKFEENNDKMDSSLCTRDGDVPMEVIFEASPGKKASLSQQNGFNPVMKKKTVPRGYKNATNMEETHMQQIALTDPTAPKKDQSSKTHTAEIQPCIQLTSEESGSGQANQTMGRDSETVQELKPEQYKCTDCALQFSQLSALKKHRITHNQEKPYKCVHCDYSSKWKYDLSKHMQRCPRAGHDGVYKQNIISEQGRGARKYRQPTFACTPQAINENVSPSCAEGLNGFPKSDLKEMSKKRKSSSNANGAIVNDNNITQRNSLEATRLKKAVETMWKRIASLSSSSPVAHVATSRSQNRSSGHVSSAEIWKCSHCAFATPSQAELKQHSSIHSEDKPYKCDLCMYKTKWVCDLKKHKKRYNHFHKTNNSQEIEEGHEEFQPRFKCSHCIIYFSTLQELTDHYMRRHAAKEVTASLYVMEPHSIHDIHCCFCKSMFTNKESFFDHLTTHEEFTPDEWELYFMIGETEQQLIKDANKADQRAKNKTLGKYVDAREIDQNDAKFKHGYNEKSPTGTDDLLVQPIEGEKSGQDPAPRKRVQLNMYTCEWCLAGFTHLIAVCEHAQQFHPIQLNEQVAERSRTNNTSPQMSPSHY